MNTIDFTGGMVKNAPPFKLAEGQYNYLSNGRVRRGTVVPIKSPVQLTNGLPEGNFQGFYTADSKVVAFVDGEAYYKDFAIAGSSFVQIPDFSMSPTADRLYAVLVPASTINFLRVSTGDKASDPVNFTVAQNASPRCLIVQDGSNQPWLIFPDGTAREAFTYESWTQDFREYVPVGLDMLWDGVTLYIVSPDRKRLYRSVSGRPVDFMIAIDNTGNKLADVSAGDADALSHAVGYADITAIQLLNTQDRSIFVATQQVSYSVIPDYTDTLFNEPTYRNQQLFSTGALNSRSYIELLGDTHFIDQTGIRSFNAVRQANDVIRNEPFSDLVNDLFEDEDNTIIQSDTSCAVRYNGYGMYSLDTIYGAAVLIYDEQRRSFVGLDRYSGLAKINQFGVIEIQGVRELLFSTTEGKLYQANVSTAQEEVSFYPREDYMLGVSYKIKTVLVDFYQVREAGLVFVDLFQDGKLTTTLSAYVPQTQDAVTIPYNPPLEGGESISSFVAKLDVSKFALHAQRNGVQIRWNFDAKLNYVSTMIEKESQDNVQRRASLNASNAGYKVIYPTLSGSVGDIITLTGRQLNKVTAVYIGETRITTFLAQGDEELKFSIPSGAVTGSFAVVFPTYLDRPSGNFTVV